MRPLPPFFLLLATVGAFAAPEPAAPAAPADKPAEKKDIPTPNVFLNAGFEAPVVKGRTLTTEGGSPTLLDPAETSWRKFLFLAKPGSTEGSIAVGMTNQYARTGKQSIFVDFQKLKTQQKRAYLLSDLLPVKAGWRYRIGVWGRIDPKRPLTKDQRRAMFRVETEFFTPDKEAQTGEVEIRTEMIPGYKDRFLFVSNKWAEYETNARVPNDAGWVKVAFIFETPRVDGVTDGMLYLDDVSLTLDPTSEPLVPIDPAAVAKPADDEPDDAAPPAKPAPEKPANAEEKKAE